MKFLFCFFWLSLTVASQVTSLTNGGCYGLEAATFFTYSPGGYDPTKPVDVDVCKVQCAGLSLPYAGIQGQFVCLCAQNPRVETLLVQPDIECGRHDDYTKVFRAHVIKPISDLDVKPSAPVVRVGEVVTFDIKATTEAERVDLLVDCGDDSGTLLGNNTTVFHHVYHLPGVYNITVIGTPAGAVEGYDVVSGTSVRVVTTLSKSDVIFDCPSVVEPNETFFCDLTLLSGSDITMTVDRGMGKGKQSSGLPDVLMSGMGKTVPQDRTDEMTSVIYTYKFVIIPDSVVNEKGTLVALHGFAITSGSFEVWVLRPSCQGDICRTPLATRRCESSQTFCVQSQSCVPRQLTLCPPDQDRVAQTYEKEHVIPLSVEIGYFYYSLSSAYYVLPGDLLAFTSSHIKLSQRPVTSHEKSDLIRDTIPNGVTVSSEGLNHGHKVKHFLQGIVATPLKLKFQGSYPATNSYNFSLEINTRHSLETFTRRKTIYSQIPIKNIQLNVFPPDVAVGKDLEIQVSLGSGSEVSLDWDFGDGTVKSEMIRAVSPNERFKKTYKYTKPGVYVIRVTAGNLHGNLTSSHKLMAQQQVPKTWFLDTDSPRLLPKNITEMTPGAILVVNLTCSDDLLLPTNATAFINFGDNSTFMFNIPNSGSNWLGTFNHTYTQEGLYLLTVNISNVVSYQILQTQVEIAQYINNLTVTALHNPLIPFGGMEYIPGFGPRRNIFPSDRNITFFMNVSSGNVEMFIIELANGSVLVNSRETDVAYYFPEPGQYNLTVYAYNHVQKKTDPVFMTVYIMDPVVGIEVTDHYNVSDEDEIKHFQVDFEMIGTDACLVVDYGDSSKPRAFGLETTCYVNYTEEELVWEGQLEVPHLMEHSYPKRGEYTIFLVAFNDVSETNTSLTFTVSDQNCKPPVVSIRNRIKKFYEGVEFWRSKPVILYSHTVVNCNITTEAVRVWECYSLNESYGYILEEVDLSRLDSYSKSMLYVPPFVLRPGTYRFKFQVNMTGQGTHPMMPFQRSVSTYVKVVPSPIIPQMSDGAQSRITRGWGQTIRLAPGENSINPDDPADKDFLVTWFCRRLPNEELDRDSDDVAQKISGPIFNRSSLYQGGFEDGGGDLIMIEKPDLGGCFGDGPGRIDVEGGSLEWKTTVFRVPNAIYEIVAKIEKPDRRPSWGAIQVVLLNTTPPAVSVRCQTPSLCYPFEPIGQKINPVRVGLIGLCSEDCDGALVFEWEMYGVSNTTETHLPDAREYIVGVNEQKMALSDDFFKMYYPTYGDFIAKLTVTNQDGHAGIADLFLHINKPPDGGTCQVDNTEGKALIDRFYVTCKDWEDPEGTDVEHFAFWTMNLDTGALLFLVYGPESKASLVLPYGDFQLGVDIKDKEEAVQRINITTVSTTAPTRQEYDIYIKQNQLDNLEAAGDQGRMNQVTQAVSSLLEITLVEDRGAANATTTEPTLDDENEERREEEAKTKAKMVRSVGNVMNMDTLSSLEQVGSALTAIAGKGKGVDNEAKEHIIRLLNKTISLASKVSVEAPQQLLGFCMLAVGTMGGVVSKMTQQLINGEVSPTDKKRALDYEYDVQVPLTPKDNLFDGTIPLDEALSKAVIMDERERAEGQVKQMVSLTIELVLAMLKNIIVGEKPLEFIAPSGLGLTISMFKGGTLSNKSIQHGDAIYVFPDVCDILGDLGCSGNETLGVLAVSWPSILESFGNSVDLLSKDTQTLQLMMLDENLDIMNIKNTTAMFSIIVPRKSEGSGEKALPDLEFFAPKIKWNEQMMYHQLIVDKADSAVNIEIRPSNPEAELLLFLKHREKPMYDSYDLLMSLNAMSRKNDTLELFLPNDMINNRTGFFYLGLVEVNQSLPLDFDIDGPVNATAGDVAAVNLTSHNVIREFSTNYSLRIYTSGCYFYDYELKIWSGSGCYVHSADSTLTHCKCNHLTSFGSGFFVTPNTIDFSYVFANAGFADNVTIYMTIIVTLLIYVLLMIWARVKDRKDVEKLGATPLPDNNPLDKYIYEIVVFTGDKDGAATDSHVQFILSGEDDETEVRTFGDNNRKIFRRGGLDTFIMTLPRPLGRLNYMRIWHDNSGKGKFRSWFLSFIVIRDAQTNQKYEFIANKWFAVEKDDGGIDRLLPVAGKGEATEFSHLFSVTSRKNLSDGHLWFSIFMRPPKSRFTRCQRVSCCIAVLYLSMLVNAMWYGRTSSKPSASAVNVGPLSLSPEQIGVGVMANLIVFPPTFLIITLFRKSKLRKLRPSRITEALKKQAGRTGNEDSGSFESVRPGTSTSSLISDKTKDNSRDTEKKRKRKKKFLFPWWCRYVAWFVCLSTIAVSVFFLWGYGVQFGDEKTRKWVTSLLISFFTSILVTQPIKVFLMAMIFSSLCKSVDNDEDDAEDDEEIPELSPDEEWLHAASSRRSERKLYKPVNVQATQRAKEERLKEIKMNAVIREILSYLLFLWILIVLSYGNRDPNAFYMQVNLNNAFIKKGDSSFDFTQATTPLLFWRWVREAVVPELQVGKWYNGGQPFGLRGFLDDRVNRLMGYGVLRQVRTKNNTCNIVPIMKNVAKSCSDMTNIIDEDREDYGSGWREPVTRNQKDEYHYRSSSELDGLPFWGKLDVYSGGGYVFPLRGTTEQLKEKVLKLETSDWVDSRTRAVFVEFSVYNAQVNLFGVVTIVAEFFPGGGIVPFYRIDPIRLMRYHEGFGLFVLLCEVFYVVFTLFFTVREIRNIRKERMAYLRSYWNIIELVIIGLSYAAIVFYIYRMVITHRILKVFTETNGNGYVKLQFVAAVDEVFGYISSFLIFIAILKFTRLLRFNRRMGVLYSTLSQCSKDLKSFCVVFIITYLAFVQVFYLIFGVSLVEFSSFINSAETSFNMMRGKFDFEAMYLAAPLLGPLIFFFFAFITSIILLNIFITLIISSFQSVKEDIDKQSNDFEIISFMKKKFKSMFGVEESDENSQLDQPATQSPDQIDRFPEKVDRLLCYINDVYFEGRLDLKKKSALKSIYTGSQENTIRRNPHKPLPLIDWSELTDDQKVLDKL